MPWESPPGQPNGSSYPFNIFGGGWEVAEPKDEELPFKGDTVVGNDVWIGYESLIMPGVRIGDGANIAARSVVVPDVPPYTVVGGNPARAIEERFPPKIVAALLEISWWDWNVTKITRNLHRIVSADIEGLRKAE